MIAKDEDGNWFAVIAIGAAVPCRTKSEAEKVSRNISAGIYIGAVFMLAICIGLSIIFWFVLR